MQTLALAQLALLASEEGDSEAAATYVVRASTQLEAYGHADYPTSALVHAAAALPIQASRAAIRSANVEGTATVLAAAGESGVRRVIFISSGSLPLLGGERRAGRAGRGDPGRRARRPPWRVCAPRDRRRRRL